MSFRLHSGLLSYHSEVFGFMIASQSSPAATKIKGINGPDGLRETTLHLEEIGDDLGDFFGILYDGGNNSFFDRSVSISFGRLRRVLQLAIKYKAQHIVDIGFGLLEEIFVSNYDDWTKVKADIYNDSVKGSAELEARDAVAVIVLARAAGRVQLLPAAFLVCAHLESETLLDGVQYGAQTVKLSSCDLKLCLNARRTLGGMDARVNQVFLTEALQGPGPHCATRTQCLTVYQQLALEAMKQEYFNSADVYYFSAWDNWIQRQEARLPSKRCANCKEYFVAELAKRSREEWKDLGSIFGLPNWAPSVSKGKAGTE